MAYNYSDDVAFAVEMIAEYGRAVTFVKQLSAPANATKPLHGPAAAPVVLSGIMAAFVEPSSVIRLGQSTDQKPGLWKETTQIALVAPVAGHDLTTFTTLTDSDGTGWKIEHVEAFKPGDTLLLYYVGVRR